MQDLKEFKADDRCTKSKECHRIPTLKCPDCSEIYCFEDSKDHFCLMPAKYEEIVNPLLRDETVEETKICDLPCCGKKSTSTCSSCDRNICNDHRDDLKHLHKCRLSRLNYTICSNPRIGCKIDGCGTMTALNCNSCGKQLCEKHISEGVEHYTGCDLLHKNCISCNDEKCPNYKWYVCAKHLAQHNIDENTMQKSAATIPDLCYFNDSCKKESTMVCKNCETCLCDEHANDKDSHYKDCKKSDKYITLKGCGLTATDDPRLMSSGCAILTNGRCPYCNLFQCCQHMSRHKKDCLKEKTLDNKITINKNEPSVMPEDLLYLELFKKESKTDEEFLISQWKANLLYEFKMIKGNKEQNVIFIKWLKVGDFDSLLWTRDFLKKEVIKYVENLKISEEEFFVVI